MDANAAAHAYRHQEVSDASPVRAVAILYDRAIESLHRAVRAIEDNDVEGRRVANEKAAKIIGAMGGCLDFDNGGEIADNLGRLYRFMLLRLMQVDLRNDAQPAREVIGLLEPLRQSWAALADRVDREGMPATPAAATKPKTEKPDAEPKATAPAAIAAAASKPATPPAYGAQPAAGGLSAGAGASVTA